MQPSESTTLLAVGERAGRVVLQFPHPVRECVIDPATAHQVADAIGREAHLAYHGVARPQQSGLVTPAKAAHLRARATLMIRSMQDQRRDAGYQARELVAMLLAEL